MDHSSKSTKKRRHLATLSLQSFRWHLRIERRDELYQATFRANDVDVQSQQLKFRKLIRWPKLTEPEAAPEAVLKLEPLLGISFLKHVNVQGGLVDQMLAPGFDDSALLNWLGPSADSWSCFKHRPS